MTPRSSTFARAALFIGAVALLAVSYGCEAQAAEGILVSETDSAGVAVVEITGDVMHLPEWALSEEPTAVLDGSLEPFFSSIGEVEWLSDGRIVVEDNLQDAIYLFDADGTYIVVHGDKGDGPGQFQNITELTVLPGDSIYVYDRTHDRLTVVHPDVGFVRTIQYGADLGGRPPLDVFAIAPNRVIVQASVYERPEASPLPRRLEHEAQLFLTDGTGTLREGPIAFPGSTSIDFDGGNVGATYSHRAIVAVAPDRVVHGSGIHYDLTVRDADFNVLRKIRWDGWAGPIPEAEMAGMIEQYDAAGESPLPPDIVRSLRDALFSPDLQPDLRPALSWRSYVDEIGRIWLSEYAPSMLQDVAPEWHVLTPEGRPIARMTLPAGTTLAGVSATSALLIVTDELDVPSLFVHTIEAVGPLVVD